jgi:protein ImuA
MTAPAVPHLSDPPRPALRLLDGIALPLGRVHELAGPARRTFAVMLAGRTTGPVMWVQPGWLPERLHPEGVHPLMDPGRLLFVTVRRPEDILWTVEEALRSGKVPMVVADLPAAPGLTPVRRLQLAAETSGAAPLGLLLTPGDGGAPGVETRWTLTCGHATGRSTWLLRRTRARAAPPAAWRLWRAGRDLRADPVAAEQSGPAGHAGQGAGPG